MEEAPKVYTPLAYALSYIRRGWGVFPLHEVIDGAGCSCGRQCGNAGKHPRVKRGLKDASTDPEQIRRWWTTWPDAPIGIVCGSKFGLLVVDIDPRNGGDATWDQLVAENGPVLTLSAQTGGGGEHLYFQAPAQPIKSRGNALGPGVDISAEGHYVVAPPSLHASGKRYSFRVSPADMPPGPLPDWILKRLENVPKRGRPPKAQQPTQPTTDGWLVVAFRAAGWLGDKQASGAYAVRCPWWDGHTNGVDGPHSSTVVFPPSEPKQRIGFFKCSHAHCENRSFTDVRGMLPEAAIAAADAAYPKQDRIGEAPPGRFDEVTGSVRSPDRAWEEELIRTNDEERRLVPCLPNAITILGHDDRWSGVLCYDSFAERIIWCKSPPWHADEGTTEPGTMLRDEDAARFAAWLHRKWGLKIGIDIAFQAIRIAAIANSYHPLRDYLQSLQWDATIRVPTWTITYLGAMDTPYHRAVGMRWMISAVARVMRPGCQADSILVLEGNQGIGKSRALRTLVGDDWFADDVGDLRHKDAADALRGKWVIELGELSSLKHADVELVKMYLTRRVDHFRPAYERITLDRPRQCVFSATTNAEEYQIDPTGLRRFWAVRCGDIRPDALADDRDLLWAEAHALYQSNEQWWLTDEEVPEQQREQDARREIDPWQEKVLDWAQSKIDGFTVADVLEDCLQLNPRDRGKSEARRVGGILRTNGYTSRVGGRRGARCRLWSRPEDGD